MTDTTRHTTVEHTTVKALAWELAADLHLPPEFDETRAYPALVSVHPIGSCKEQTSGSVYARALAAEGFVVLAYDASFQGASGGTPRAVEDPYFRVQDIGYAIDHLVTLPYVDADRIGAIGVCGGGGYAVNAAMTDRRIKAVGSVTGVNFGRLMHEGFSGYDPLATLDAVAAQRTAEARGAEPRVDPYLPPSPEAAEEQGLTELDLTEAVDYYRTARGRAPGGRTEALFSRQATAVGWDAFHRAEVLLTRPLCIVVGDKPGAFGAYRDGLELYRRAASTAKELVVAEGFSHYDLYDRPEPARIALTHLIPFYKKHL
ncbi:alpha/beta hydrolase [Streptomyces catenulae]|uniref:Alpha/beta hydrolase n=1 Tax=Streptomyces catenulae TaxID=66875 RepID=A0ABV2YRZ2_9ACTN|nr:alpha/beta hydrolase [Streptomyces catenulae]